MKKFTYMTALILAFTLMAGCAAPKGAFEPADLGEPSVSMIDGELSGGLTEGEKSALTYCFGNAHGIMAMQATREELIEWDWLTPVDLGSEGEERATLYQWEEGVLFSIRADDGHDGEVYSLPVLFFDADKWRSPLGAYFFNGCSAAWPEFGTWSDYEIGSEAIS